MANSVVSSLLSKEFREDAVVRAFVKRVVKAFGGEYAIPDFHSDNLIEHETGRLEGCNWLEFAVNPEENDVYTSDLSFLYVEDLVYWLPAIFIQGTINFMRSDGDLQVCIVQALTPGAITFRDDLKQALDRSQIRTAICFLRLRQIRIKRWIDEEKITPDPYGYGEELDAEWLDLLRAIEYWSENSTSSKS